MLKIATLFAIATTFIFLLTSRPLPKRTYHSLFISPSLSDNASISHHLHSLTRHPHIAGSAANAAAAVHVLSAFSAAGIPSRIASYKAALTYPVSRTLTLIPSPSDPPIEFSLRQENVGENPYADEAVSTFHAYAKSGAAAGPVVYANFGRVEDFAALIEIGVNVAGTIVLARYGEIYRGDIVRNAYVAGAVGVVVYTDKKDYGGKRWFPEERWMPPSGVQVGTLYNGLGDPTTPGWASTMEECERISEEEIEMGGEVPLIPSLPVSGADAEVILRSVGGHVARDDWQGGEGGGSLVYKVGPGPGILNLDYIGKQVIEEIQNVIGVIEGAEEPDRFVILGNHRDAWTFGAVDPNSGTAALIEVAERLGKLQKSGWKPRRTILLCNWDAEEYGLIGSTEWVEENREMLASRAVAYLNVDCAVSEPRFYASATPQLDELLIQATKQVPHPDNSSQTVYEAWLDSSDPVKFGRLGGGGSDFAAFVQHIGIPAAAMSFDNGYPVYHSLYDDFTWMKKFGDPMFQRHVAVASVWGLVALWLADAEVLPFNYLSYAEELRKYAKEVENEISGKEDVSLSPLFKSIEELTKAATKINNQREEAKQDKGWLSMWKKDQSKVRELNDRLMMAERAFTDRDGLLGRSWYKHLIYGPSKYNDYGSKSFPGIDDAIEVAKKLNTEESWKLVQHEIWRVSRAVKQASQVLGSVVT